MSERHLQWLRIITGLRTATSRGLPKAGGFGHVRANGRNRMEKIPKAVDGLLQSSGFQYRRDRRTVKHGSQVDRIAVCWD